MDVENNLNDIEGEFPFFNEASEKLVELRRKIKKLYAEEFTNLDINKASNELEKRLQGSGKMKQTRLIFFYLGIVISCILFLIFLNQIPIDDTKSLSPFFPPLILA